ncbi:suppressor of fused domain protein [Paenibacillus sp. S150]|uniref:suppressor of fused domain protein n=1 Tax=Paenibacillus sp. S150 TaxID=2749826 RepID=UPI001C581BEB|nr:suppressor of fused domain protein [Paenibacillus sp. S150]MBW4080895.1 suppressor of fused domain protein [Paenibacillus sp. S150]
MSEEEANAAGWDAIDEALGRLYGEQEFKHYGTAIPYMLGGPDPLNGISVYEVSGPLPHWHFVTYGFSELYEKETEDPEHSGYGFELTFRLFKPATEEEPPAWALNLLQNLGRYVFNSGNVFRSGDYMDANGPIALETDTMLTALAFIGDPQLPVLDTPNGRVEFIQVVGITNDELLAMQVWNTLGVLAEMAEHMPLYISDLQRDSLLKLPSISEAVRLGSESDGSNTGALYVDQLAWESPDGDSVHTLQLGAKQAEIVGKLLRGRLLKGRSLTLAGPEVTVSFEAGDRHGLEIRGELMILKLDEAVSAALSEILQPVAGLHQLSGWPELAVRIVPTHITDSEGNVVKTIG